LKPLQVDKAVDKHLKPVKDSDGTMTALEVSTDTVRVKNLEVLGDFTYQAEYGFVRLNDDGTQDANENNFGLGSTVYGDVVETIPLTSSNISWDDTNKVFSISKSGVYEVVCDCKISTNATFSATLAIYINAAADTLGTNVQTESFEVDSGDDPVPSTIRWMGRIENGEHIAVTLDAGNRTPMFEAGSTLRILRIA
tara:strand:- start:2886 stop:3473 length:588 start_codon:yes stop_codon:yes gene_type:complete